MQPDHGPLEKQAERLRRVAVRSVPSSGPTATPGRVRNRSGIAPGHRIVYSRRCVLRLRAVTRCAMRRIHFRRPPWGQRVPGPFVLPEIADLNSLIMLTVDATVLAVLRGAGG
ncbi:hypothetical protein BYZ73_06570 [Rhodovulum viride]|uniref:Uncharacterized protein n=1 Tax=Rhodovulum viride TaxID=1231134 RepID=A0ABX9DI03_9RHOB|nr:hypothetical protein BYZ73_06570 [Rhodovulum viride]